MTENLYMYSIDYKNTMALPHLKIISMHYLNLYLMSLDCHNEGKLQKYVKTGDVTRCYLIFLLLGSGETEPLVLQH